tara:strand:+ start:226 stop:624 length:399 start_codon:yes stop_codon:yes gene_type:complete
MEVLRMAKFSKKSLERLESCDDRLFVIFTHVIKHFDCTILEGKRSRERQAELVAQGKSKTLESKHIEGKAVDVAPYPIDWEDRERFHYFAGYVMATAQQMGVNLRWGGDWDRDTEVKDNSFDDLVHFEIVGE